MALELKEYEDYAELTVEGVNIRSVHYSKVARIFVFGNQDEDDFEFYETIKNIEIQCVPTHIQFEIYQIMLGKIPRPLERLPAPFNSVVFGRNEDCFFTRFHSFYEGDDWKWDRNYFLAELKKYDEKDVRIKVDSKYKEDYPGAGKYFVEVIDNSSRVIGEAFESALSTLRYLVVKVENSLLQLDTFVEVIEIWKNNKHNSKEEFWQKTFKKYSWIISQTFSAPMVIFQDKAYLGGKDIGNQKGKVIDFAFKNKLTKNLALIEIKTPQTALIGSKYRGIYSISSELSGAINQVLTYRDTHLKEFYAIRGRSEEQYELFDPKCLLIIGSTEYLDDDKRQAFELFRNNIKCIDILTFDELFEKIYLLLSLMKGG